MTPVQTSIKTAFEGLARAVETGDVASYRNLARDPNPFQTQLFERNSAMFKKGGMRMAFVRVDMVSERQATVHFAVTSPTGQQVEQGEMMFALCDDAWLVDEL